MLVQECVVVDVLVVVKVLVMGHALANVIIHVLVVVLITVLDVLMVVALVQVVLETVMVVMVVVAVQEHVLVVPMGAVPVQVVLDVVHVQVVHHAQDVVHLVIDNAHLGAWDVQVVRHLAQMVAPLDVLINASPLVMPVQGVRVDVHQIVKILVLQVVHQLALVHALTKCLVQ